MVDLQTISLLVQIAGVSATAIAAVIGVRSYINSNKRADEAKMKEQETRNRDLETRQAQLFMSSMFDRLSSSETGRANAILNRMNPKTVEDLRQLFANPETLEAWRTVWWVYEGLGVLVHENLVDIRLVARYVGNTYKADWEKWGPVFKLARAAWSIPRMAVESEYLYDKLIEFGKMNPEYHIVESNYVEHTF